VAEIENCVVELTSAPGDRTAVQASGEPINLSGVIAAGQCLSAAKTQVELLGSLVEQAGRFGSKVVLFVASEDQKLVPYQAEGFEDDSWRSLTPTEDDPVRISASQGKVIEFDFTSGDAPAGFSKLGLTGRGALIPLAFDDFCPAVLLVQGSDPFDLDSVLLLVQLARLTLQNQQLLNLLESGKAREGSASRWPMLETAGTPGIPFQPVVSSEAVESPAATGAAEKEEEVLLPPSFEELLSEAAAEPTVRQEGPAATEAPGTPESATVEEASILSEPVKVISTRTAEVPASEEEVLHHEARRFARLLVAEIKLYNETEVEEGRRRGDLFRRLEPDIARSREMYEKRVHPLVGSSVDYLHEELVRVLAQDNPDLLGEGYPGPRVSEKA